MCDDAVNVFQDAYLLDYFMNQFAAWDDCLVMKEFNFRESHRHGQRHTPVLFLYANNKSCNFPSTGVFGHLCWHDITRKVSLNHLSCCQPSSQNQTHPWDALSPHSRTPPPLSLIT